MTDTRRSATSFDMAIAAAQGHVDAERWSDAIAALEQATRLRREADGAWRALGDARHAAGDGVGASAAHDRAARLSLARAPIADAVAAIRGNRLATAEEIVRARLRKAPTDIAAIVLLSDLAIYAGNMVDAVRFLRRVLELAPELARPREKLGRLLYDNRDLPEALAEFDRLLGAAPDHLGYRNMRAATLDLLGRHDAAIDAYRAILDDDAAQPLVWMTLGNVLNTIGDVVGAVSAYRRSLALAPTVGESWWGLANLKSLRFSPEDITAMQAASARADLPPPDRMRIEFALGKAFEDAEDYDRSFAHYAAGNSLQVASTSADPGALAAYTERCEALFTPTFFAAHVGGGDPAPDPIFIVGLPRSGSTLVEQILASHPAIEGTAELPELPRIARALGASANDLATARYPEIVAQLSPDHLVALGADYLRRAGQWRRTDRPLFIDKLPANFLSIGLIKLILPNAKVIDVRRHPLGCGLSVFKQHFPKGAAFATSLDHIGRYYADYVRLMALWDARLPGFVHRVIYERLIGDPELQVRSLLDFLGLPFDAACLQFHANDRAVSTPSAGQVRRPIYTDAIDHWHRYDVWLGPLKEALGDTLDCYPDVPTGHRYS